MPIPTSTYRLQLRPEFDFLAAAAVADYLGRLGVSHLYASPYLQAAPGSAHGYDVVDPTRLNEELGGEEGHQCLQGALEDAGLGQILDIVPNHMAISGPENRWWWDVLRNGPAGRFAPFFDVDWDPPERRLRNHVLMPILGDHFGRELEAGDIRIEYDDEGFSVRYHDHRLPLAPRSLGPLLVEAAERAGEGRDLAVAEELAFLGRTLESLPEPALAEGAVRRRRQRDLETIDRRLAALLGGDATGDSEGTGGTSGSSGSSASGWLRGSVAEVLTGVNGDPDRLDEILRAQNYRLAYWRTAGQELDYRRFFDIDTLAGLRTEDPEVFDAVHERVLEWLRAGVLDGVRVDHPDGLRRPAEYFRRIREAAPEAWVVAEKILMPDESLPDWPVHGTTGYDLLNDVTGVFVDPAGEEPLTRVWREWAGYERAFHDVVYEARKDVLREVLAADVNRLANIFVGLCETRRRYRDFTRPELRAALVEVAANFPVYRTYVGEAGAEAEREERAGERDRRVIEQAMEAARSRDPELDPELLDFLRSILVGETQDDQARGLRMRFQQLTGPVAAKGEEDTAFYRYHRLVALNEVGGDPGRWGLSPSSFHERMVRRWKEQPWAMTTLSTHDTKRSEDVRARLVVLSEIPEAWVEQVGEWRRRNAAHWPDDVERDPATEYLLYQTLVGAWPIDEDRVSAYMEKATREAKRRTSWTDPDAEYDSALRGFIARLYESGFGEEIGAFVEPLVGAGRVVSLAQKLVQLTVPGVPDIYQGTELWDLSLVDPDNRRPVDYAERGRLLDRLDQLADGAEAAAPAPERILESMDEGLPKLWVVRQALRARTTYRRAFAGGYRPLDVRGEGREHVVAYARGGESDFDFDFDFDLEEEGGGASGEVVVVVPRMVVRLARGGGWRDTRVELPAGEWTNVMTGERLGGDDGDSAAIGGAAAAELFGRFPVALLVRGEG